MLILNIKNKSGKTGIRNLIHSLQIDCEKDNNNIRKLLTWNIKVFIYVYFSSFHFILFVFVSFFDDETQHKLLLFS